MKGWRKKVMMANERNMTAFANCTCQNSRFKCQGL